MPQLPAMNEEKMDALLGVGLENLLHWAQLLFSLRWLALAHVLHAVVPWPFIFLLALLPAAAVGAVLFRQRGSRCAWPTRTAQQPWETAACLLKGAAFACGSCADGACVGLAIVDGLFGRP